MPFFLDIDNSAVLPVTIYADDFETDQLWSTNPNSTDTATTGHWARANPGNQTSVEGSSVMNLPIIASDPENDTLGFAAGNLPTGLSINSTTGVIGGTLTATPQVFSSSVTVSDNQGNDTTVNFSWTITVDNEAPEITNPGPEINQEGESITPVIVSASDADNNPLTFSATGLPPGLTIAPSSGVISGALDFDSSGSYTVTVFVSDGIASPTVQFDWTINNVNRAPVFDQSIANQSNDEGDTISLSASASDPDADSLNYSAKGLPDGTSINVGTGEISGTLSASSAGNHTVGVTVTDGGLSATQTFSWAVADVNLPPTITNPGNQSNQQSEVVSLQIVANDPEAVSLAFSATGLPADLTIDVNTGLISGTVNAAAGSYSVTVDVSDGSNQVSTSFNWTVSEVSTNQKVLYMSSTTGGSVSGVSFSDEDILTFDTATNNWLMYLDGSDVGLSGSGSRDINAFTIMGDGSVIFSVIGATTLPDVGSIDDSDLIHFIPTSLGTSTSGTFELYFDGSDVGLTNNGEDIDAVNLLSNGDLLISTIGSHGVSGGISGADEDLLLFTPTNLGSSTSGSWSRYFDGSDVALNSSGTEDVYATSLDEQNGDIYLSTRSDFSVSGVSGTGADVFVCSPGSIGSTTSCVFSLFWDGSAFGYGSESIDGFFIEE